jgi:hypothetical protein
MSVVRLTDDELALVRAAARPLPVEDRDRFLQTLAAELRKHRDLYRAVRETQEHLSRSAERPASPVTAGHRAAHGYEPTREAAMAAFAKSWRRERKAWTRSPGRPIQNDSGLPQGPSLRSEAG